MVCKVIYCSNELKLVHTMCGQHNDLMPILSPEEIFITGRRTHSRNAAQVSRPDFNLGMLMLGVGFYTVKAKNY